MAHGCDLRRGRYSETGRVYLLTLVCADRAAEFGEFSAARTAVRAMHQAAVEAVAETLAFVVMPDHVHWLIQLRDDIALGEVVRRYKACATHALGRKLWQRGFHDHALRHDEDLVSVARYIVANPVRAGLVRHAGDYPHWDAAWLG